MYEVSTEFKKDPRQPYLTIEEIYDKFKLIVDIKRYKSAFKPGMTYRTQVFVTLKAGGSQTETRQIDLKVFFMPKLDNQQQQKKIDEANISDTESGIDENSKEGTSRSITNLNDQAEES